MSIEIRPARPTTPLPAVPSTESSIDPVEAIETAISTDLTPPVPSSTPSLLRSSCSPLPALPEIPDPSSPRIPTADAGENTPLDIPSPTQSPHLAATSSPTHVKHLSLDESPLSSTEHRTQLVSSPGGRSIGRSVIISGIEFEPFLPTSTSDSSSPVTNAPLAPAWLLRAEEEELRRREGKGSVKLTGQEMRDFFGSTRSIKAVQFDNAVDEGSLDRVGEVNYAERRLTDEDGIVEEVQTVESSPRMEPSTIESTAHAMSESLPVRDVKTTDVEEAVDLTTPIVDAVEVSESSPPLAEAISFTADDISVIEYPVEVEGLTTVTEEEELSDLIETTPSPPTLPSDPFDRIRPSATPSASPVRLRSILGRLSTIGRGYSVSAVGLGYGSLGRSSVLSMGGDERSSKLSIKDWILRGEETRQGGSVFHIDVSSPSSLFQARHSPRSTCSRAYHGELTVHHSSSTSTPRRSSQTRRADPSTPAFKCPPPSPPPPPHPPRPTESSRLQRP